METLETPRLVLRPFRLTDWRDLLEVARDWNAAPGPAFDKWPDTEEGCREFCAYLSRHEQYAAVCLRDNGAVIGLVAINGEVSPGCYDLGHVIRSGFQDDDIDREAIGALVEALFAREGVTAIVTRNAPEHAAQLAPLLSLGFLSDDPAKPGELELSREVWERRRSG